MVGGLFEVEEKPPDLRFRVVAGLDVPVWACRPLLPTWPACWRRATFAFGDRVYRCVSASGLYRCFGDMSLVAFVNRAAGLGLREGLHWFRVAGGTPEGPTEDLLVDVRRCVWAGS